MHLFLCATSIHGQEPCHKKKKKTLRAIVNTQTKAFKRSSGQATLSYFCTAMMSFLFNPQQWKNKEDVIAKEM